MKPLSLTYWLASAALLALAPAISRADYIQTNLVSDQAGVALHQDISLINPWGLSSSSASPIWVSDNGTGLSTLYNTTGVKQGLVVTIPGAGTPTGQVFNITSDFANNRFIFATEDGTISSFNGTTSAVLRVDNSASGAVYKGLALGNSGGNNFLYAANFNTGAIDVFNSAFAATTLTGNFTDAALPAGYAPFNVQNIGGKLYVTYALQDAAKHDDVSGAGHGFVDVFNTDGTFSQRLASGGTLDSPWGLTLAPAHFGEFRGDLLVGNFGDGRINAFDSGTGAFLGQLTDHTTGAPIAIDGLWGLINGNGGNGGLADAVYFSAGPGGESHGLFGSLQATPEPGAYATFMIGGVTTLGFYLRRRRKS